jgi:phosphatidylserine/phosphatidylglycerophosphate/cardiolipin synthase-like enzyme
MSDTFSFSDLDAHKATPFPPDYIQGFKRFFSPQDDVHGMLKTLLNGATQSLLVSMYGEDDPELTAIIVAKAQNPNIFVQVNLDKTQAAGQAEVPLVKQLESCPNTRVAIGMSQYHKINHLKVAVIDGLYVLGGSTNWSTDGQSKQNNEANVVMDRAAAHEATMILNAEHQVMLNQMGQSKP